MLQVVMAQCLGLLHVSTFPRRECLLNEWCWGNRGDGAGGGRGRIATFAPHTMEQNKFQMDETENVKTMK